MQILRAIRRGRPALPVVLTGDSDDADSMLESLRIGARDYLAKPIERRRLEAVIRANLMRSDKNADIEISSEDVEAVGNGHCFFGISPVTRTLRAQIGLLAQIDAPLFIFGEPGSGKETAARLLHRLSVRSGFTFARVNCAALPEDLLEREIFGAIEGDGSSKAKPGKLELCRKGTIFLDDITEMSLRLQSSLVEVLRKGQSTERGVSEASGADVRVVAAGSVSVDQAVSGRRLLSEFSHLLSAYALHVPPLRERKDEIPFLSRHFMHRLSKHYGLPARDFVPAVLEKWQAYGWPGNLRELEQSVKRYLILGGIERGFEKSQEDGREHVLDATTTSLGIGNGVGSSLRPPRGGVCGHKSLRALLRSVKEEAEKSAIALALDETGWNRKAAARLLKTSYRTVLYKIEQYQMTASASLPFSGTEGFGAKGAASKPSDRAE